MDAVRMMFDGYDTGIRYADRYVGRLLDQLASLGILDECAVMISADHGETLGELNIYCDHQTADQHTTRVPMILRWPGLAPRVETGLHYQFDVAATLVELLGGEVPDNWDAVGFSAAFQAGETTSRPSLILSQGAWTCQRSVRFDDYLCIRTYHDGYHAFPDVMLFDVIADPHEQTDLAVSEPALARRALAMLDDWERQMLRTSSRQEDPLQTVISEGGPFHVRGQLPAYLERLEQTGRSAAARALTAQYGAQDK